MNTIKIPYTSAIPITDHEEAKSNPGTPSEAIPRSVRRSAIMSDSAEICTFQGQYSLLHEGIQSGLDELVREAKSKALIGSGTAQEASMSTWTKNERASAVMTALESRIKTDPSALYVLLKILKAIPVLKHLAFDLQQGLPPAALQEHDVIDHPAPTVPSIPAASSTSFLSTHMLVNPTRLQRPTGASDIVVPQPTYYNPNTQTYANTMSPPEPPTFEEIIRRCPESMLGVKCDDIPLAEIAAKMERYETLHMYLTITDIEMQDICQEYSDPLRQRQKLLHKWRQKFGYRATYNNLADCFRKANRLDLVQIVIEVVLDANDIPVPLAGDMVDTHDPSRVWGQPETGEPNSPVVLPPPFNKSVSQLQTTLQSVVDEVHSAPTCPRILMTWPSMPGPDEENKPAMSIQDKHCIEKQKSPSSLLPTEVDPVSPTFSTKSSDSLLDSFKTACSHITPESSDSESTDEESKRALRIIEVKLDRVSEKCAKKEKKVRKLRDELKEKDKELIAVKQKYKKIREALKQLEQKLAEREQQLAERDQLLSKEDYPQQETEPHVTDALKQELKLTNEYVKEVEDERNMIARKYEDAIEESERCKAENRFLKKQVWEAKCELIRSGTETHMHKETNKKLEQRVKELETMLDFFLGKSDRRRSQSV